MPQISAVIITFNEEELIGRCLESLQGVADEIIVVDSYSTDQTEVICMRHNVKFVRHEFGGYKDQKNFALAIASNKNILALDADEALSDDLKESIIKIKDNWEFDGYFVKRRNYYCGRWIKHSEWYPDRQMRLFHANWGKWGKLNIHERFIMQKGANIGELKGDIHHWVCQTHQEHLDKLQKYSKIGAHEYYLAGKSVNVFTPFIHSFWGFFRKYIIKCGFLDGNSGYLISSAYARATFHKYKYLRQLIKTGAPKLPYPYVV